MKPLLGYLALFSSVGTLLCCALPSLLVLLGLGAAVAGFLSAAPWLVALSHHKNLVFGVSGALIGVNLIRSRRAACPVDAPDACTAAARWSRVILYVSAAIYVIGVFSAFVLGPLLMRFAS